MRVMNPGRGKFGPSGMVGRIYVGGHQAVLHNLSDLALMVLAKKIFKISSNTLLYKHMTPLRVSSLEPRGLIGRNYVGDH